MFSFFHIWKNQKGFSRAEKGRNLVFLFCHGLANGRLFLRRGEEALEKFTFSCHNTGSVPRGFLQNKKDCCRKRAIETARVVGKRAKSLLFACTSDLFTEPSVAFDRPFETIRTKARFFEPHGKKGARRSVLRVRRTNRQKTDSAEKFLGADGNFFFFAASKQE